MSGNNQTSTVKRLSLDRRVDLIMAFYRDAANRKFNSREDIEENIALLRREIKRQIENAIRDDRELREPFIQTVRQNILAIEDSIAELERSGTQIELTDEELCPSCGVPGKLHGTVHTGKWRAFVCAGISGSKIFISPDAAAAVVDVLTEKQDERESGNAGDAGAGRDETGSSGFSVSGE